MLSFKIHFSSVIQPNTIENYSPVTMSPIKLLLVPVLITLDINMCSIESKHRRQPGECADIRSYCPHPACIYPRLLCTMGESMMSSISS